jgi:hypothetical protein
MRQLLAGLLFVSLGCASHTRSGFIVPPQAGIIEHCSSAPSGSDARLSLIVLTERGDTLRTARIRFIGTTAGGAIQPVMELEAASPSGAYELGPFPVGQYQLSVSDSGRQTAYATAKFCNSIQLHLQAVLASTELAVRP